MAAITTLCSPCWQVMPTLFMRKRVPCNTGSHPHATDLNVRCPLGHYHHENLAINKTDCAVIVERFRAH